MKTHLYTLCWNEADMLEFFFRNYDSWVDRYIIYDDGSTDGSIEILKQRPKVELRRMRRKYPDSHTMSQRDWMNEIWKESRGHADWAVMVDIDEHLFAPQTPMRDFLERYKSQGVTMIPALGFQMLSEDFPEAGEHLVQSRACGTPWEKMCKLSVFNPNMIEETNFSWGRHTANAAGRLKLPRRDELLLFHYKYLGFEPTLTKLNSLYNHVGAHDKAMGFLTHYACSPQELRRSWDGFSNGSGNISWTNYNPDKYPYFCRWWRPGILLFVSRWFRHAKSFARGPFDIIKRLIALGVRGKGYQPHENFGLFIEEINRSPIRKEIYRLIMEGGANGSGGDAVVAPNGKDKRGVIIQCLHSDDADKLQGNRGVQKVIAAKKKNKEKYNKDFDSFVITNSKSFTKDTVAFAKNNNVHLVSRKDLIEFISRVEVSCE